MRRRTFVAGIAAVVATTRLTEAQQAGRVYRVGLLRAGPIPHPWPALVSFLSTLRESGFAHNNNLRLEIRAAEGRYEQLPTLAADLVRLNVDAIVASTTPCVLAAKQTTKTVPIVMTNIADPVGSGLVEGLARPGGNVTGLADIGFDLNIKILELMKELLPHARRVVMFRSPNPASTVFPRLQKVAEEVGLTLEVIEIRSFKELEDAFEKFGQRKPDAVWWWASGLPVTDGRPIQLPIRHQLPSFYQTSYAVKAGGLMSYDQNDALRWQRVARYVAKILQGAKPHDLPIEQARDLELAVNLKTAKSLGIVVPRSILLRADYVIE
jgi:putative ABC transport system substrate-binding protein